MRKKVFNQVKEKIKTVILNHKKKINIILRILSVVLTISIFIILIVWAGGIKSIYSNLKQIAVEFLIINIFLYGFSWILRGLRWRNFLNNLNINVDILKAIKLVLIGGTYNVILPAKLGDIARITGLKKENKSKITENFSTIVTDRYFDFVTVFLFTISTFLMINFDFLPEKYILIIIIASIIFFLGVGFYFIINFKKEGSIKPKLLPEKFNNYVNRFFDGLKIAVKSKLMIQIILSLLIWGIEVSVACFFAFGMIDFKKSLIIIIAFSMMLANLSKIVPFTPGGIGTYELIFASILTFIEVPIEISVSIAILDHLFKNMFLVLCGIVASIQEGLTVKQIKNSNVTLLPPNATDLES